MSTAVNRIVHLFDEMVEKALQRFFPGNYPLQPVFIEKALENAISENTKIFKHGILPPSSITIHLHETDYQEFSKFKELLRRQLTDTAKEYIEREFAGRVLQRGDTSIRIELDSTGLPQGQIRLTAEHLSTGEGKL